MISQSFYSKGYHASGNVSPRAIKAVGQKKNEVLARSLRHQRIEIELWNGSED